MEKKILLIILIAFTAIIKINAEELYDKPVVEYYEDMIGENTWAFIGVDTNGDKFADLFILIRPLEVMLARRMANMIQNSGVVSIDDRNKSYSATLGAYTIRHNDLLEIGGRSVLELFPGQSSGTFPTENTRQQRLQSQGNLNSGNTR